MSKEADVPGIEPATRVSMSIAQLVGLLLAIGGVGYSVGAILLATGQLETAVERLDRQQQQLQAGQAATAEALRRVSEIVERLDRGGGR